MNPDFHAHDFVGLDELCEVCGRPSNSIWHPGFNEEFAARKGFLDLEAELRRLEAEDPAVSRAAQEYERKRQRLLDEIQARKERNG